MNTKEEKFFHNLTKLEPAEFLGLLRFFNVPLIDPETSEPREFADMFADFLDKYNTLSRKARRTLFQLVKR